MSLSATQVTKGVYFCKADLIISCKLTEKYNVLGGVPHTLYFLVNLQEIIRSAPENLYLLLYILRG